MSADSLVTDVEPKPGGDGEAARWEDFERRVAQATLPSAYAQPVPVQSLIQLLQSLGQLVIAVLAGLALHRLVPHPLAAVIPVALLAALRLALVAEASRVRGGLPAKEHLGELDEYRRWLPRRVPAVPPETLAAADECVRRLERRWGAARLLIARREPGHPNTVSQQRPVGNLAELVLDHRVAEGPPAVAVSSLGHEAAHCGGLMSAAMSLSTRLVSSFIVIVAAWALPWPGTFPAAAGESAGVLAGLRLMATLLFWVVEIRCDLAGASFAGPTAERAAFDLMAAEDARATRSFTRRAFAHFFNPALSPPHPPLWLRRAAISLRHGR